MKDYWHLYVDGHLVCYFDEHPTADVCADNIRYFCSAHAVWQPKHPKHCYLVRESGGFFEEVNYVG